MFDEFAIDPIVFKDDDIEKVMLLTNLLCAIKEKGQLANLNGGVWFNVINEMQMSQLSPKRRNKIRKVLEVTKKRNHLVEHQRRPTVRNDARDKWLHYAQLSHEERELFAVISNKDTLYSFSNNHTRIRIHSLDFIESTKFEGWSETREAYIRLIKSELFSTLEPVLRNANEIHLIDPYLAPENRFKDILDICSKMLRYRTKSKKTRKITLYTMSYLDQYDWKKDKDPSKDMWSTFLFQLLKRDNISFEIIYLTRNYDKKNDLIKLHDRFIFTNQCGVRSSKGWDIDHKSTSHITFMDYDNYVNIYHEYHDENKQVFKRVCSFLINP
ncbi:MAG: hypothetical protein KAQ69_13520 [Spirochaetales bacterium]|nr:hypothetical protein [Spirochaetales bacterium]